MTNKEWALKMIPMLKVLVMTVIAVGHYFIK